MFVVAIVVVVIVRCSYIINQPNVDRISYNYDEEPVTMSERIMEH